MRRFHHITYDGKRKLKEGLHIGFEKKRWFEVTPNYRKIWHDLCV
jgi:hypothetical protein